jgi:hypothetical protein
MPVQTTETYPPTSRTPAAAEFRNNQLKLSKTSKTTTSLNIEHLATPAAAARSAAPPPKAGLLLVSRCF